MSKFSQYMLTQEKTRRAYERYNYAGVSLENARIHERLAEINSQSEPLDGLITRKMGARERLYAAAYYVVIGRFPEKEPTERLNLITGETPDNISKEVQHDS